MKRRFRDNFDFFIRQVVVAVVVVDVVIVVVVILVAKCSRKG